MIVERPEAVSFAGKMLTVIGRELKAGDEAPYFTCVANDLTDKSLNTWDGMTRIISVVPSLDTKVCDLQTRRFNEAASALENTVILTISMDLPFAQKRWCGAAGVDKVITLSDHREASFGTAYGTLIRDVRLLERAVFIVGPYGKIRYAEYVSNTGSEPDYEAALEAART